MRNWRMLLLMLLIAIVYTLSVMFIGYEWMAIPIHFGRIMFSAAALIIFVPEIASVFSQIPAPRRDYLLAAIIFFPASALFFTIWNEAGRQFGVDTSIFTSPVAGFFSLLLVIACVFAVAAPAREDKTVNRRRYIALVIGALLATLIALVSPYIREVGSPWWITWWKNLPPNPGA